MVYSLWFESLIQQQQQQQQQQKKKKKKRKRLRACLVRMFK